MFKLRIVLFLVIFVKLFNLNRASRNYTDYIHGQNKSETLEKENVNLDPMLNFSDDDQTRLKRGVKHLSAVLKCAIDCEPSSYNGYGCYCGFQGSGEPVDSIDSCCKDHDECYEATNCSFLKKYLVSYSWTCNKNQEPTCGNVEILHNGKWGNICDDEWDELEAKVVCRQLGFDRALRPTTNGHFGQARRRFWMDNLYCDGTEDELAQCRFDGWSKTDCKSGEAAGVICMNDKEEIASESSLNFVQLPKMKIKDLHQRGMAIRLTGGRSPNEGRIEINLGNPEGWGVVCGDGWSLLEAGVICRQLGLGYAAEAIEKNFFGGRKFPMVISGIECQGNERNLAECLHDKVVDCPGPGENVAGVVCTREIADLVFDHIELMRTAHLEDRPLYWLQCAMEENCVASRAYKIQRESDTWHLETRRLLRFTARTLNAGNADFRPSIPKHLWEWHMCHMHYHSMEVFATFDIIDSHGRRVAEGHKASFCLEDNQCMPGVQQKYKCANYGDQGVSVNCSDVYKYNIDCQWVDITELEPGLYTFKVAVNPEFKVGEMSFDNNAAVCQLLYTETFASVHSCVMARP